MKQLSLSQDFDCPLELLLKLRQERYQNPERYPELKNIRVISEEREGTKLHQVRQISLSASLPESVSAFWPSSLEKFSEKSIFDTEKQTHDFEVSPADQNSLHFFHIKGRSQYKTLGTMQCQRQYEVEVTSKAFLIGGLIETFLADLYTKNLEKDRQNILKAIASSTDGIKNPEDQKASHSEEAKAE